MTQDLVKKEGGIDRCRAAKGQLTSHLLVSVDEMVAQFGIGREFATHSRKDIDEAVSTWKSCCERYAMSGAYKDARVAGGKIQIIYASVIDRVHVEVYLQRLAARLMRYHEGAMKRLRYLAETILFSCDTDLYLVQDHATAADFDPAVAADPHLWCCIVYRRLAIWAIFGCRWDNVTNTSVETILREIFEDVQQMLEEELNAFLIDVRAENGPRMVAYTAVRQFSDTGLMRRAAEAGEDERPAIEALFDMLCSLTLSVTKT